MTKVYAYTQKIGRTNYIVNAWFDENSKETFEDKLLKVIEQEMDNTDDFKSDEKVNTDESSPAA